ncbi:hypothetical protein EZV73_18710 [Acidaminobacter sp. JC074]|uniref:hypothetical protein n=1 Tax=Acidaminobacter sp. JC074 TaxID=2530199 RepID=UPI001F1129FE|nr:hypothetical protein [Acidaminobacter sp. JC074]MCH4889621.1 hypothetical protein [Acidaminobacter sp. JC074]
MRYQTELYVKKRKSNKWITLFIVVLLLWGTVIITDYYRTTYRYEKPMFTITDKNGADVNGSGKYLGLGYSVDLIGNFTSESEQVKSADFYLFGMLLKQVENDQ